MSNQGRVDCAAVACCRAIATVLRHRTHGKRVPGAPDWIAPECIESVSAALSSATEARVVVALKDGVCAHSLPALVRMGGSQARLVVRRAARAVAHGAPSIERGTPLTVQGTVACLMRDRLNPVRNYVLTCGHVAAPDGRARAGDPLTIMSGASNHDAFLVEWQPALGGDVYRTPLDAALVEVSLADALALRSDPAWLPTGLGDAPKLDRPITARRASGPNPGMLKVVWSGYVDLPDVAPGYPDYFMENAIGYLLNQDSAPGDSGSAVWDDQERLMGVHIGALPQAGAGDANAIYGPIAPILEWFAVQPYLRDDAATLSAPEGSARRTPSADGAVAPGSPDEVVVVAQTLWGEARGEGERGMRAVASVIENRLRTRYRGKTSATSVCQDPWQFSCWLASDPNHDKLLRVPLVPDVPYGMACSIARELAAGALVDITSGARHYFDTSMPTPPNWAIGHTPCASIGSFKFYNDVA